MQRRLGTVSYVLLAASEKHALEGRCRWHPPAGALESVPANYNSLSNSSTVKSARRKIPLRVQGLIVFPECTGTGKVNFRHSSVKRRIWT